MDTSVALIIFNRPHLTRRVFGEIAKAKPKQLLIIADGPRSAVPKDVERCAAARAVVQQVNWECEVKWNCAANNMGCKHRVSSGLDWIFDQCDEAIILEDDCLPHPTFFRFCEELLQKYRYDERLMVISGSNFQSKQVPAQYSYYFSAFSHIWGWATWRRAWQYFDGDLTNWPSLRDTPWLLDILGSEPASQYWRRIFNASHAGQIDSWAYPWMYSCWTQSGFTALPSLNLVTNIGFGKDATHTKNRWGASANRPTFRMTFPLRDPPCVKRNLKADLYTVENVFKDSITRRLADKIHRRFPLLFPRREF